MPRRRSRGERCWHTHPRREARIPKKKTFAEIAADAARDAAARPARRSRPGRLDDGVGWRFEDGDVIRLVHRDVTAIEIAELVAGGAHVAVEPCGCRGGPGCGLRRLDAAAIARLAQDPAGPVLRRGPGGFDVLTGPGGATTVLLAGDVLWGGVPVAEM